MFSKGKTHVFPGEKKLKNIKMRKSLKQKKRKKDRMTNGGKMKSQIQCFQWEKHMFYLQR